MKNFFTFFLTIAFLSSLLLTTFAHSGRTDSNGGHYDHSTGIYHYHNGNSQGKSNSSSSSNNKDSSSYIAETTAPRPSSTTTSDSLPDDVGKKTVFPFGWIILGIVFLIISAKVAKKLFKKADPPPAKKMLHQHEMLEPVSYDIDTALSKNSTSFDNHCFLIAETESEEFYSCESCSDGSGGYVLKRSKSDKNNVVYFGQNKSLSCVFHNYLFQANHWENIYHYSYIYRKNITTGEITEFDWLGKGWVVGPFHHLYCQDSIDTMYTDGEKLIIEVTRRKSDPTHSKDLTPSQQKFDYDTPYRIEVVYEDGKFRRRTLFPQHSQPTLLLNPPENS